MNRGKALNLSVAPFPMLTAAASYVRYGSSILALVSMIWACGVCTWD
jgi:hypothetical protein